MSDCDFTVEAEESSIWLVERTVDIVAAVESDDVSVLITNHKNEVVEYDGDTFSAVESRSEIIIIEEEAILEISSNIAVSVETSKAPLVSFEWTTTQW